MKRINHKRSARWQHLFWLKASSFLFDFFCWELQNTTSYSWDWYCHLLGDKAPFAPLSDICSYQRVECLFIKVPFHWSAFSSKWIFIKWLVHQMACSSNAQLFLIFKTVTKSELLYFLRKCWTSFFFKCFVNPKFLTKVM